MKQSHQRKIAVAAAGLIALAGAGGTYAATKTSRDTERQAFLDDVAKRLKVDPKDLTTALREAFFDRLDAAVAAGKLTKAQADAIKKRVTDNGGVPPIGPFGGPGPGPGPGPGGPPPFGPGGPRGPGPGRVFGALDGVAKFLRLTDAQLRTQLRSGKSLADIAKAQGKSVDDLKAAIKDGAKTRLDAAVKDKKLTQDQEDKILKELDSHLDDIVNGKAGMLRGKGKRHRGHWVPGGGPPAAPGTYPGSAPAAPAPPAGGQI